MTASITQSAGTIRLNIVDGMRQDIPQTLAVLIRALDGRKQAVSTICTSHHDPPCM